MTTELTVENIWTTLIAVGEALQEACHAERTSRIALKKVKDKETVEWVGFQKQWRLLKLAKNEVLVEKDRCLKFIEAHRKEVILGLDQLKGAGVPNQLELEVLTVLYGEKKAYNIQEEWYGY